MKEYIYKSFVLIALLTGFCITGCQSDELTNREEVQLQVLLDGENPKSRANVGGTTFQEGNKFRFFFNSDKPVGAYTDSPITSGNDDALKKTNYTYNLEEGWTTTAPIYWDDHQIIDERNFCAIMPFDAKYDITGEVHTFSIISDQSITTDQPVRDSLNYKASDLLLARTKTNARLIPLKFWHILSRVVVNITASTDVTNKEGYFGTTDLNGMTVALQDIKPDATITYGGLTVDQSLLADKREYNPAVTTAGTGTKTEVQMLCTKTPINNATAKKITATYVAVIPPQEVLQGERVLTITLQEGTKKEYYFRYNDSNINFEQSKQLTIDIALRKNKVELSIGENDIKIEPWGTITAIDDNPIVLPK